MAVSRGAAACQGLAGGRPWLWRRRSRTADGRPPRTPARAWWLPSCPAVCARACTFAGGRAQTVQCTALGRRSQAAVERRSRAAVAPSRDGPILDHAERWAQRAVRCTAWERPCRAAVAMTTPSSDGPILAHAARWRTSHSPDAQCTGWQRTEEEPRRGGWDISRGTCRYRAGLCRAGWESSSTMLCQVLRARPRPGTQLGEGAGQREAPLPRRRAAFALAPMRTWAG